MHLITGHSGSAHITSANDGAVNAHVFGNGSYVFDSREKFEPVIVSATEIQINSGEGLHNGRYFEIAAETHDTVAIDTGSIGTNRIDLIVARYSIDGESGIETMQLVVIKGTPAQNPVAPAFNSASILDGASVSDYPLYKVTIEGITLKSVTPLFTIRKDIVNDVLINNAETVAQIAEDNQQTVEAVQTSNVATKEAIEQSNAETKAEIKADNASTLAGVQTSNAETLAAVQASNAETKAAVQAKVDTVLTATVIWEAEDIYDNQWGTDISHPSINGYKYVEVMYRHLETVGITPVVKFLSTGKLPVMDGNKIDGQMIYIDTCVAKCRPLRIVGKKTYTSEANTSVTVMTRDPETSAASLSIFSDTTLGIYKILAYK